jgi:hypothetical protein
VNITLGDQLVHRGDAATLDLLGGYRIHGSTSLGT